ncbi:hypothetical protein DFAR_1500001 [Desulfarculales bacterium]
MIPCPDGRRLRLFRGRTTVIGDAAAVANPFLGGEALARPCKTAGRRAGVSWTATWGSIRPACQPTFIASTATPAYWPTWFTAPPLFQGRTQRYPGATELVWQVLRS